jgi:hypothetical protein
MKINFKSSRASWCISVITALGRLKQEHHEFKASLEFKATIVRACLRKKKKGSL